MTELRKNMGYERIVVPRRAEVPAWLILTSSPEATRLYMILALHVASGHPVEEESLAELARMSIKEVARRIQELQDLGAIDTTDEGALTLHFDPPAGHAGPRTIAEYYARKGE